jgi:tRNA pseudouridine32 synthase/23S rRNA pseudouridine746 synthase
VKRKSRKLVKKLNLLKKDENYLSLKKLLKKLSKKIEEDLAAQKEENDRLSKLSRRLQKKEASAKF